MGIQQLKSQIYIDNFRPYVERIEIFSGSNMFYEEWWEYNSSDQALIFSIPCGNGSADGQSDVDIIIYTSEPMQPGSMKIIIDELIPDAVDLSQNGSNKEWHIQIPQSDIAALLTNYNDEASIILPITIEGNDIAGNPLQGFTNLDNTISLDELAARDDEGNWDPQGSTLSDIKHQLRISGGNLKAAIANCYYVNFSTLNTTISDDQTANFENESSPALVESWYWEFEGGIPSSSNLESPEPVSYRDAAPGKYFVKLTATYGGDITYPVTKNEYITVNKSQAFGVEIDFTYKFMKVVAGTGTQFQFIGSVPQTNFPNVQSWEWVFNEDSPQTGQNSTALYTFPEGESVSKVTLTIHFNDGTTRSKTQKIYHLGY
jgi:hypothetical protein